MVTRRKHFSLYVLQPLLLHNGHLVLQMVSPSLNFVLFVPVQAKERVEKQSIQPDSKTALEVTKVEKIENLQLQRKFLEAQRELISPQQTSKWLFYGGPENLLYQVVNKGFRTQQKLHSQVKSHS